MKPYELLDVPEEAGILIDPIGWRNEYQSTVEDGASNQGLSWNLDFLRPENVIALLSGESADLISLDIDQRFDSPTTPITVLPPTPIFSFLGIVNVTVDVELIPELYFAVDVTMGIDTEGFYILENDAADLNIEVGGGLRADLAATGRLTVVPLAEVVADLGISAFAGVRLDSPRVDDPKLRGGDITPSNIDISAGLDLNLGLTGKVGFIDTPFVLESRAGVTMELFRTGGSAADLQSKLTGSRKNWPVMQMRLPAPSLRPRGITLSAPSCLLMKFWRSSRMRKSSHVASSKISVARRYALSKTWNVKSVEPLMKPSKPELALIAKSSNPCIAVVGYSR